jgi:hypothetical protein
MARMNTDGGKTFGTEGNHGNEDGKRDGPRIARIDTDETNGFAKTRISTVPQRGTKKRRRRWQGREARFRLTVGTKII